MTCEYLTESSMNWLGPIIAAIIAAIGGIIVLLFRSFFDRRKVAEERAFADKREHYRNILLCLKSFREGNPKNTELFWFEYSFLWLHAPDSVITSANTLVAKMEQGSVNADELAPFVGELLLQIRRDMGFPKTALQQTDFKGKFDI